MKFGSFLVILKKRSAFPSSYLRKSFVHLSFSIKVKLKSRNSIDKCYVLMTGGGEGVGGGGGGGIQFYQSGYKLGPWSAAGAVGGRSYI